MELKQLTALITGSTGRLGTCLAKALAEAGCNCVCHYNKNEQAAKILVEQIRQLGAEAIACAADLTVPEQIESLFDKAAGFDTPRILINAAGVFPRQPLQQITFQDSQRVLALNLTAPILTSQVFAKMINAKFPQGGTAIAKIINISDVGGIRPWAQYAVYCSSKAGLIGATKALAKELAPEIYVNSIAPGLVTWPSDFDESQKSRQLSFIPTGRIAQADEIATATIFLLENDYITGQVLNVDGGRCI